jgi:hypothetical protein
MTLTANEVDRQPARWRTTQKVLLQAELNYERGSVEPLNFDCADYDPFSHSDDEVDDSDRIDDSDSLVGGSEAQTY